ncbi:MAG TPA: DUF1572 family protein [Puia sp.]|jgi:hypothetical protein|nr:DUF1572 family protein [Puia sp.]
MLSVILANFYERDLRRLIDEINLFQKEDDLWRVQGGVKNAAGNLALHIIGGLNYLIGTNLAHTGYVRNRDLEFTRKGVKKQELVTGLEALIPMIRTTLNALTVEQMEAEYPIPFDDARNSNTYVLTTLLAHLNYHLGQVNYLRRMLE